MTVKYLILINTYSCGCRGRSPLPEREVSSLTLSSPSGPQARQKNYEWMLKVIYLFTRTYVLLIIYSVEYNRNYVENIHGRAMRQWMRTTRHYFSASERSARGEVGMGQTEITHMRSRGWQ